MSKRKKLRTSGEGICTSKAPKNPRFRDSDRSPQHLKLGPFHHPEESEGRSGPAPSAEQNGEEPGQVASSSLDKEAVAPSGLLPQPEKDPVPFPLSQNSVARFVPRFAKSRKAVMRPAAVREEDLRNGTFNLETEPSTQQAGSQSWEESPGLTVWKSREPGDLTQEDVICFKHGIQNPVTSVSSRGDSQPEVASDVSPECGMVPLALERASQNYLLEQGTNFPDSGSTEGGGIPGDHGQKGYLPSSGAEEKEPDQGAPQEEGAQGTTEADQEKDSILALAIWGSEPGSAAQAPMQILSRASREAEGSCSSPRCSSLTITVIHDVITDPTKPEKRAMVVPGPGGTTNVGAPASPSRKAPNGGHIRALIRGMPLAGETTGGRGKAEQESEPPGDVLGVPAASLALAHGIQKPTISDEDSSLVASEIGPVVDQTQMPGLDQEGLGGTCALPLLSQPSSENSAELGSQNHEQDLGRLSLSFGTSDPLLHREAVDGPPQGAMAHQGSLDAPIGSASQPQHLLDSAAQPRLGGFSTMGLSFQPDCQIQDAFEAPPEQLLPAGSGVDPCWPGTSLGTEGGTFTKAQPSTLKGIKPREATRMEDATSTLRGLIVELSNLNRLIMNAHRDLEAVKRLNYHYWKAKPAGKAPTPYTLKGAGTVARGEQSWRDL